MSTKENHLD